MPQPVPARPPWTGPTRRWIRVSLTGVHYCRPVSPGFFGCHFRVREESNRVSNVDQVCSRPIDAQHSGTALTGDDIRFEAQAVGAVEDRDQLTGQDICSVHKVEVHRHRPHIMQVSLNVTVAPWILDLSIFRFIR